MISSEADFRRVLAADLISRLGSFMSRLAIPWLAVLTLHAGPLGMAALALADTVAASAGSLLLGPWIDASEKRRVMLLCDGLRALLLISLPLAVSADLLTMSWLLAVVMLNGLASIGFELAQSAWIAQHSTDAELDGRNARLAGFSAIVEAFSFGLTGWLFALAGATLALLTDAATYLCSALLLFGLRRRGPALVPSISQATGTGRRQVLMQLLQTARRGFAVLQAQPTLRVLAVVEGLNGLGAGFAMSGYMLFVSRDLGLSTTWLGWVFATGGLGAALGAAISGRLQARWGSVVCLQVGLVSAALGALVTPLAALDGVAAALALLVFQQVIGDAGMTLFLVQDRGLRQRLATPDQRATVDAALCSVGLGATVVGVLAAGLVGEIFGARSMVAGWAVCSVLAALMAMHKLRRARVSDEGPMQT
jgi:MFS family permease